MSSSSSYFLCRPAPEAEEPGWDKKYGDKSLLLLYSTENLTQEGTRRPEPDPSRRKCRFPSDRSGHPPSQPFLFRLSALPYNS